MNQKGLVHIILAIIIVALASAVGYSTLIKDQTEQTSPTQNDNTPLQPALSPTATSGWKKYSGAALEFEYPSLISVKQDGETVVLSHSIAYKHTDPCDFKGDTDTPPLDKLSDFGVSIMVSNKNL
ncbi:MAG: hypothetical protein U1A26_00490, partial [Candidatus Sungbacteria bacterium]|nr:hypothetical protein [Candidatus Sungbacteria bacterium]